MLQPASATPVHIDFNIAGDTAPAGVAPMGFIWFSGLSAGSCSLCSRR